jgi:hypothetical protein
MADSKPQNRVELHEQRLESLLDAFWGLALEGDHKSGELCRRLLQQQADLFGLAALIAAPSADEGDDELAKLRARRTSA